MPCINQGYIRCIGPLQGGRLPVSIGWAFCSNNDVTKLMTSLLLLLFDKILVGPRPHQPHHQRPPCLRLRSKVNQDRGTPWFIANVGQALGGWPCAHYTHCNTVRRFLFHCLGFCLKSCADIFKPNMLWRNFTSKLFSWNLSCLKFLSDNWYLNCQFSWPQFSHQYGAGSL